MRALNAHWTLAAILVGLAVTPSAYAGPIELVGDVALIPTPTSFKYGIFGPGFVSDPPSSGSTAVLFIERDGFIVPDFHSINPVIPVGSTLSYQISQSGMYTAVDLPDVTLPTGSRVTTYILHYDDPERQVQKHAGKITFDRPILGIQTRFCFDCGIDNLFSPANINLEQSSGLEIADGLTDDYSRDIIVLSSDRKTIEFDFHTDVVGTEDLRIIFVPEPSMFSLFGAGLAYAAFCRPNRRINKRQRNKRFRSHRESPTHTLLFAAKSERERAAPVLIRFTVAALGTAVLSCFYRPASADPIMYRYVNVDLQGYKNEDFGQPWGPFVSRDGTLLTTVWSEQLGTPSVLFASRDGTTKPVAYSDPNAVIFGARMNAAGQISFTAWNVVSGESTIYRVTNGTRETIAPSSSSFGAFSAIDNAGNVYFNADGGFIDSATPSTSTHIVSSNGPFGYLTTPSVSGDGTVAFLGELKAQVPRSAVGMFKSGTLTYFEPVGQPFNLSGFGFLDINDAGTVVTPGYLNDGSGFSIVMLKDGLWTTVGASTSERQLFWNTYVNNHDQVIYTGIDLTDGEEDWFISSTTNGQILAEGDALFGSKVDYLQLGSGFGDRGEFSFFARLNDGRQVIVLALPIPEPPTVFLSFTSGVILLGTMLIIRRKDEVLRANATMGKLAWRRGIERGTRWSFRASRHGYTSGGQQ